MIRLASQSPGSILLVDLNNFSLFPTLPVGLIAAVLRRAGHRVEVLSPLAVGVQGSPRPKGAKPWGYWDARLRWWSATTPSQGVRAVRKSLGRLRAHQRATRGHKLMDAVSAALDRGPALVLVSTYLIYHAAVQGLCARAAERGIPIVLGGPAFHEQATRSAWLQIEGLTGIFAGEAEGSILPLVEGLLRGDVPQLPGYTSSRDGDGGLAVPLEDLDAVPFPDYDDFPWERYPHRVVSMLTARGCGWGVCRFCSDVMTVAGRGFRTRSIENVLAELIWQHDRHGAALFCFSDLKLNSNLSVWRGLQDGFQAAVPGAKWTCAVHAGPGEDEGLGMQDLRAARRAGLVRITTGLESASPRLLESMGKGTHPDHLAEFLEAATQADISTRVTLFTGYPGEEPSDIEATARFLERLGPNIERVHPSRLLVHNGTPLERDLTLGKLPAKSIEAGARDPLQATTGHQNLQVKNPHYGRALRRLLRAVHSINRRPLRTSARELEGVM